MGVDGGEEQCFFFERTDDSRANPRFPMSRPLPRGLYFTNYQYKNFNDALYDQTSCFEYLLHYNKHPKPVLGQPIAHPPAAVSFRYRLASTASFFFIHYSRATYLDHGESMYSPFPVRCPRNGGSLQAPLCPPPRPVPRRFDAHQGNYKGKKRKASVAVEGKTKERHRLHRSCGRHEVGRG